MSKYLVLANLKLCMAFRVSVSYIKHSTFHVSVSCTLHHCSSLSPLKHLKNNGNIHILSSELAASYNSFLKISFHQKVTELRMNKRSSSFLIHRRSLLMAAMATGFVTRGPNTAYSSKPCVNWNNKIDDSVRKTVKLAYSEHTYNEITLVTKSRLLWGDIFSLWE